MITPRHEMILASAGSGKTHALTRRFLRLLAAGAEPERIVALTFTRKAAGEFFEQILRQLAGAAGDAGKARRLAVEIRRPEFGPADFLPLLRKVVEAMSRLMLGTLDGFFARVVRSFPFELGLDGTFQILEESAGREERRRVLRRMFAAASRPDAAQREFFEAFKRATFGLEEKQLARLLDGFLSDHTETYLAAPSATQWGDPARIWPDGNPWLEAAASREAAVAALAAAFGIESLNDKQRARIAEFFAELAGWQPGAPLPKPVEYVVQNAFAAWPGLEEITLERRKVALSPDTRRALREVVEGIGGMELARRLEMTRGLFAVLRGYERNYHELVRRSGRLTFADVLRLLVPAAGAPVLSGGTEEWEDDSARLAIDWRLDARFDHWLLDEFQDTSFAQWSVLRNLIDEAVQDPEERRTFFYVGDVKQSIFSWRGGDPALFREIFSHYNARQPAAIAEGRLDASWRSGPAVIAMVNRVFGGRAALDAVVPAAAVRWNAEWRDHTSARPELGGCAEWRTVADEAGRFGETLRLLQEIDPVGRGLEAAVIVRTNAVAAELAEYLRREGRLAAVAESDRRVAADNPLSAAMLALLRAAAHPGDSLAQEHLNMTPLGQCLTEMGLASADAVCRQVLADLHADGFAGTIERWLRRLAPVVAQDAFSQGRGRMLVAAAAEFDQQGSRDVATFLEFAAGYTVRELEAAGAIRVMTVHKAKGLGFDVVILPDLEGRRLAERREGLAIHKREDRSIDWVLHLPGRLWVDHEPVLAAQFGAEEVDGAYENLCLLYVAMTRAKRAMYVVTEPVDPAGTSANFPRLLSLALEEMARFGRPDWYRDIPVTPPRPGTPSEPVVPSSDVSVSRALRRPALTPSGADGGEVSGTVLFSLDRSAATDFGHAVHRLFSAVEWDGPATANRCEAEWAGESEAGREVLACLRAAALEDCWIRPPGGELWRERAFEAVIDGAWTTGVFDRVMIERTQSGRAVRARVIDFKTDRVASAAEIAAAVARHSTQLNLYRRVVALFLEMPVSAVCCELVFTRLRRSALVPEP
jgi:ATP-dependent helicase/nuclease subunit A